MKIIIESKPKHKKEFLLILNKLIEYKQDGYSGYLSLFSDIYPKTLYYKIEYEKGCIHISDRKTNEIVIIIEF